MFFTAKTLKTHYSHIITIFVELLVFLQYFRYPN